MDNIKFWFHSIACDFWVIVGNILIYIEPGTMGSKACVRLAKKHYARCIELAFRK